MPCTAYQYQPVTKPELLKMLKWLQNKLMLRDWTVHLYTTNKVPAEVSTEDDTATTSGMCQWHYDRAVGYIWVSPARCATLNDNPFETLCHEVLHGLICSLRLPIEPEDVEERLIRTVSPYIYYAYCRENRLKIAKEST